MKSTYLKTTALAAAIAALTGTAQADKGYSSLDTWAKDAGQAVDSVMVYPTSRLRGSGNGTAVLTVTYYKAVF